MNINRFNKLVELPTEFSKSDIKPSVAIPTKNDYALGYIVRYFTQKVNDKGAPVIEIDRRTFASLIDNTFYTSVDLDWAISGDENKVKEMNFNSVKYAAETLLAVQLYLPNFLQFYKK
jgi:hypothetical protein